MSFLSRFRAAVRVDDELLGPLEAEQVRSALELFFLRFVVRDWCPGDFFSGGPQRPGCDFRCGECWSSGEAR